VPQTIPRPAKVQIASVVDGEVLDEFELLEDESDGVEAETSTLRGGFPGE